MGHLACHIPSARAEGPDRHDNHASATAAGKARFSGGNRMRRQIVSVLLMRSCVGGSAHSEHIKASKPLSARV